MADLIALTAELARHLDAASVPYAIGGAIALGFHAPPRGTQDIDINLFVDAGDIRPILEELLTVGFETDLDKADRTAREHGDVKVSKDGVRIDVFVNSIPLHDAARGRRQQVVLLNTPTWILSAEDLLCFKLLFDRPKDWVDCRRIVAVQGELLDIEYARRQLVDHVGETHHRVTGLDEMWATFGPGGRAE